MTVYDETFGLPAAFPTQRLDNILARALADAGLTNLRIAETEKYAHVTYFFNGGEETVYPGESRILIPSPSVPTYDLKPEMSAYEVGERAVAEIASGKHAMMVLIRNGGMGHTGVLRDDQGERGGGPELQGSWRRCGGRGVARRPPDHERREYRSKTGPFTAQLRTSPLGPHRGPSAPGSEGRALGISPTLLVFWLCPLSGKTGAESGRPDRIRRGKGRTRVVVTTTRRGDML